MKDFGFFKVNNELSDKETEIFIYKPIGDGGLFEPDGIAAESFNKEIAQIPAENRIILRMNSYGGNVFEGLSIYNYLKQHRARLTCVIDGACASIATIIACAAQKVVMMPGSIYAIHKPWSSLTGSAEDMRKGASDLDEIEDSLVDIYHEKTKLSKKEIKALLEKSSIFKDKEAKEKGFVDEISETRTENKFDFGCYMNELKTQIERPLNQTKEETSKMSQLEDKKPPATEPIKPVADVQNKNDDVRISVAEYQALLNSKNFAEQVRERELEERRKEITNMSNTLVNGGVISNSLMNQFIADAAKDESRYAVLKDMHDNFTAKAAKQNTPSERSAVETLNAGQCHNISELLRARNDFAKAENHVAFNRLLEDNKKFLLQEITRNEITVDSGLKRDYIMKNIVLEEFAKIMTPVADVFCTTFKNVPLEGTSKARIQYYPDDAQAVKDFYYRGKHPSQANNPAYEGYQWDGAYEVGEVDVDLDCHKYVDLRYTDKALSEASFVDMQRILDKKAANLAYACWLWLLNKITASAYSQVYPEGGTGIALNKWNYDAIVDLKTQLDLINTPFAGRSLVMNATYANQLLKGRVLQSSEAIGAILLTKGSIKELTGFELIPSVNLPNNGEKLVGFATVAESLFVINQPVRPDSVIPMQYQVYTDPNTGLSLEWTKSGDAKMREVNVALEVHMGAKAGNPKALTRIISP